MNANAAHVQEEVDSTLPCLLVLHPSNEIETGKTLVVDGNHRLRALRKVYGDKEGKVGGKYATVPAIILHPMTPKEALRSICLCMYHFVA